MSRLSALLSSRALLAALGCAVVMSGCKGTEPEPNITARIELARRHNQWAKQNMRDYAFDYEAIGMAPGPPLYIVVVNGVVSHVVNRTTGVELPVTPFYPTIETLFETAAGVLENDLFDARIEYDGARGFPTKIEAGSQAADAGFTIIAGNLSPLGLLYAQLSRPDYLRSWAVPGFRTRAMHTAS